MTPKFRAAIFDMDGTLIDSEEHNLMAAVELFKRRGVEVVAKDFEPFIGGGADKYIGGVAANFNVDVGSATEAKAELYAIYDELIKGKLKAVAGGKELIDRCKDAGLKVAVGTSADWVKLKSNLRELGMSADDFDAVVQGLEVKHKKPDPETFLKAAKKLGMEPSDCVVFEDAPNGVTAAKAGGFTCIGVTTTFTKEQLCHADLCVENLENVFSLLMDE